ncbi:hypothetical protein GCM10027048_04740 [Hymenobacter coalescens]
MRRRFLLLFAAIVLALAYSCRNAAETPAPECQIPATIRDLRGFDGCGFVLELDNGKRLEPHGALWENYAKHDGERVTISYTADPVPSICMVGAGVRLACVQQLNRCGTPAPDSGN